MVPSAAVGDTSGLLMSWSGGHGGGGRLNLTGFVWLSTVQVVGPNFTLLDHLLVLNAELIDGVIITTSQESTFFLEDFETPSFTVKMRNVDKLLVCSVSVDNLDSSIIVTNENSTIQNIKG